jgi:hypothetical protein
LNFDLVKPSLLDSRNQALLKKVEGRRTLAQLTRLYPQQFLASVYRRKVQLRLKSVRNPVIWQSR